MARRIIRTSGYTRPSRTVVRRKDGKLTERQKWLNSLGKQGMFDWEVKIIDEDGTKVFNDLESLLGLLLLIE